MSRRWNLRFPLSLAAALALGVVLGRGLLAPRPPQVIRGSAESPAQADVLARLERIEVALSRRVPATEPVGVEPVRADSSEIRRAVEAPPSVAPAANLAPLESEIAALARAVEALQQVVRAGETSARFPSLELLRRAPAPVREELDVLVELSRSHRSAELQARVHWKSQEELLATYGRPDLIWEDGRWLYDGRHEAVTPRGNVEFSFTSDYVSRVLVYER